VLGPVQPGATAHGAWRPATRGRPTSRLGLGLAARSSRGGGSAVCARGGTLASGSAVAGRWQGSAEEDQDAPPRAPVEEVDGGLTEETTR
jgi:hypothetical protein